LAAHNPEINWETGEVKIMRCPPMYGRNSKIREKKEVKRKKRVVTIEKRKMVRWAVDNKEDWGREEEVEADHRKIEEIVPKKFLKWRKVFGKVELERMPTRKVWDHTIDLKEMFKSKKKRIYPLSKVGFLGVVIGPNGIEMEKEKIDEVLSWSMPKNVKDIRKFWVSQITIGDLLKTLQK